jgi:hypothetical protein
VCLATANPGLVTAPACRTPDLNRVHFENYKGLGSPQTHNSGLGYPFNRSWRFASTGGSAKVAPSWVDGRDASAVWGEPPLGYGS